VEELLSNKEESVFVHSDSVMEHPFMLEVELSNDDDNNEEDVEEEDLMAVEVDADKVDRCLLLSLAPHSLQLLPSTNAT